MWSLVAAMLFIASGLFFNGAASNWWIASFHASHWHKHSSWGNAWFVAGLILVTLGVFVVIRYCLGCRLNK
jgi:hypothetical protein